MRGLATAVDSSKRAWPLWPIALAAAAGALIYATHLFLYHRLQGEPASFLTELAEAAVHFGAWAALVPLVVRLGRRWPLVDRHWPSRLVLHLGLGLAVALIQLSLHTMLDEGLIHGRMSLDAWLDGARRFFVRTYYANVVVYLALVVGDGALAWARRRRDREAELERHLARAQLDVLRQQLQPHFLFNALNAVSTLVAEEPAAAQRMIARLADLLRMSLDERNAAEVPLWRELELASSYLAIEQLRFGDRLTVCVDVPAEARQALVPGLLLQPLLENAGRHGLARRPGPGRIEVTARIDTLELRLRVADRGTASDRSDRAATDDTPSGQRTPSPAGIGLDNVRARLRHLYGDAQGVELVPAQDGTVVDVRLPLRFAPEAAVAASHPAVP